MSPTHDEVPLMQCNTCGSEVPPDQIKERDPLYEVKILLIGIVIGGFARMLFTWFQVSM